MILRRRLKLNFIKFLRLKGSPNKIARGFALGACVNFYPTFGVGVPFAALMAGLFSANIPAGLIGDVIFKPLFPLFFYLNFVTGRVFWHVHLGNIRALAMSLVHPTIQVFGEVGKVFMLGALINTFILGSILYTLIYFVVERYRVQLLRWLLHRRKK